MMRLSWGDRNIGEVEAVVTQGEANRHYGSTNLNAGSSRSHTIFRMDVESRASAAVQQERKVGGAWQQLHAEHTPQCACLRRNAWKSLLRKRRSGLDGTASRKPTFPTLIGTSRS